MQKPSKTPYVIFVITSWIILGWISIPKIFILSQPDEYTGSIGGIGAIFYLFFLAIGFILTSAIAGVVYKIMEKRK